MNSRPTRSGVALLDARAPELAEDNNTLEALVTSMLRGRAALRAELIRIDKRLRDVARTDDVCRLMMSVPDVGPPVAMPVKAGIHDLGQFRSSKMDGGHQDDRTRLAAGGRCQPAAQ